MVKKIAYLAQILFLGAQICLADTPPPRIFSKVIGDSANVLTGVFQFPNFTGTHTGTGAASTLSLGVNSVAGGGTGNTAFTAGSIVFSNGTILTQDNTKFFWDGTNFRLGINTATPTFSVDVTGTLRTTSTITVGSIATSFAGAPLSINSSQVIVGGITSSSVTSITATSVTTTTSTLLTITPAAGTYNVWFNGNVTASSANNTLVAEIAVAGTSQGISCKGSITATSNAALAVLQPGSFAAHCQVTVSGSQAISTTGTSSTGTATITGMNMLISRVQ
jgi:hypothetical protein